MKYWLWLKAFVLSFFHWTTLEAQVIELAPPMKTIMLKNVTGKFMFVEVIGNEYFLIKKETLSGKFPLEVLNNLEDCHLIEGLEKVGVNSAHTLWEIKL